MFEVYYTTRYVGNLFTDRIIGVYKTQKGADKKRKAFQEQYPEIQVAVREKKGQP